MEWSDIGRLVGSAAPLVGGLLGGPAGAAVGNIVAGALGVGAEPDKVSAALAANPEALVKLKQLEMEHEAELRRMALEAETARLSEINQTMRAEYAANDAFVRRWRPLFGYMMSLTWGLQVAAIVYVQVAEPGYAAEIVSSMANLVPMWAIALSVVGVSISKRSDDKAVAAGLGPQPGLIGALAQRIAGKGGK